MLEIPACNAGAYREYLVCHETLQDRPCLRLPVCGETAVLCSLLSAFHPFYPPAPLTLFLSSSLASWVFCNRCAHSLSSRRHLSITSCEHLRIKCWKIPLSMPDFRSLASISLPLKSSRSFYETFTLRAEVAGISDKGRTGMLAFRSLTRFQTPCNAVILLTSPNRCLLLREIINFPAHLLTDRNRHLIRKFLIRSYWLQFVYIYFYNNKFENILYLIDRYFYTV